MAEIPFKFIIHQFTIINSIFHFLKLTFFDINAYGFSSLTVIRLKSWYTMTISDEYNIARKFFIPNNLSMLISL